jgi:hypothetical protein
MNKLREFLDRNGIKYRSFAKIIKTSPFTLHGILNDIRLPTLTMAYEIEKKTMGAVTLYDWVLDINKAKKSSETNPNSDNNSEK